MSKVQLFGDPAGSGTVTIAAPNTNSNVTLTLPTTSGTVSTSETTLTQFNVTGSAPVYACRAWVNFNGTGAVAIRASGNVSSITDNGTGDYTINFTTAMPDANYCFTGNGEVVLAARTVILQPVNGTYAVGSVRVLCINNATDVTTDTTSTNAAIFR